MGRVYEADVIRINSQSGKGGIGYILETQFKLVLPAKMREQFGYHVKSISDHEHRELAAKEVYDIFLRDFVNLHETINVLEAGYDDLSAEKMKGRVVIEYNGKASTVEVEGNGRLDCVSSAIKRVMGREYVLENYVEHALEERSTSQAASYVCIVSDGKPYWGAGIHTDIMTSSVKALVSAVNRMLNE